MDRNNEIFDEQEGEISLGEIVDFLRGEWLKLAVAAAAGLVLAVGGVSLLGQYKAEAIVLNSSSNGGFYSTKPAIDFVSWKYLQKALPELAAQLVQKNRVKAGDEHQFRRLSSQAWWQKNVVPVYALSKTDNKELALTGKEFDGSMGAAILYFAVTNADDDKEKTESNLAVSIDFMRSGSTYWALETFVTSIDTALPNVEAELRKTIAATEIERAFLVQKAKNYELLRKRFPHNALGATNQVVDAKDAGAKFLPIDTQLVAINTEIYGADESLVRMRDKLGQQTTIKDFLKKAIPAIAEHADGLALGNYLLATIAESRKKIGAADTMQQQALVNLESDIMSILARFSKGLQRSVAPEASRTANFLSAAALGFFGGGITMLLAILGRHALGRSRKTAY